MGLLADLGEKTGTQMDMTHLARQKFEQARDQFGGDQPELLVCKLIEESSEVELQVEGNWVKHWEV